MAATDKVLSEDSILSKRRTPIRTICKENGIGEPKCGSDGENNLVSFPECVPESATLQYYEGCDGKTGLAYTRNITKADASDTDRDPKICATRLRLKTTHTSTGVSYKSQRDPSLRMDQFPLPI